MSCAKLGVGERRRWEGRERKEVKFEGEREVELTWGKAR